MHNQNEEFVPPFVYQNQEEGLLNDVGDEEEPFIPELSEEEIETIENDISGIPEDGWLDKYLSEVQNRLKTEKFAEEYKKGSSYWIDPGSNSLILRDQMKRGKFDPTKLYRPRIFVWLPHHLVSTTLYCTKCEKKALPMEWVAKTKARRIIDEER